MKLIEGDNPSLRGVPPKTRRSLGELVDLISGIGVGSAERRDKDIRCGPVYKYFLYRLAPGEGKGGGELYTLRSVVQLLVEVMEPLAGRVYDRCCGSGGMFAQVEPFVAAHGGPSRRRHTYGQNSTTPPVAARWHRLRPLSSAP
jgi:type I restriction enzyme M protein